MTVFALFFILCCVYSFLGYRFSRRFLGSRSQALFISGTLGLLILVLQSTTLLFLGLLESRVYCGVTLFLIAVAWLLSKNLDPPSGTANEKNRIEATSGKVLRTSVFLVTGVILLHTLAAALTPEVRSDPLRYHLRLAQQYALRGELAPLRENPWWAIPQYAESLFATGILLWNDTLAKLFHWVAGFLTVLGIYHFTHRRFGAGAALWALLLWVTTPKVSYEMTTTYVEMFLTLWVFSSFMNGLRSLEDQDISSAGRHLILSGFLMGMAFGTKYTAFAVQGVPWLIFPAAFFFRYRSAFWTSIRYVVLAGVALLLADSPWLLRNLYHTGNPIYPLYNHLFGLTEGVDYGIETFFLTVWPGANLLHIGFYYERILGLFYSGYIFPGLVVLLPLVLFLVKAPETHEKSLTLPDRIALSACALSFLFYLVFTGNMDGRFYLPTLSILVCYLGVLTQSCFALLDTSGSRGALLKSTFIILLIYNYIGQRQAFFEHFQESAYPILTEESRWNYYKRHEVGEPEGSFWEKAIPPDSLVYNIGFPYRLKAIHPLNELSVEVLNDRPRVLETSIDPLRNPFFESDQTPESLRQIALNTGVDYLLLPSNPAARKDPFWWAARAAFSVVPETQGRLLAVIPQDDGSIVPAHP